MNQKRINSSVLVFLVALFVLVIGYVVLSRQPVNMENKNNDTTDVASSTTTSSYQETITLPATKPAATSPVSPQADFIKGTDTHDWSAIFDPSTVRAGDLAGTFIVSYVSPGRPANFDVKFSGEATITGKIEGSCFRAIDAQSKNLLPRLPHPGEIQNSVPFCFKNPTTALNGLKGKSAATIVIGNFESKMIAPGNISNQANFMKLVSAE